MPLVHDAFRQGASQNVAYNTSGGASVSSTGFSAQTYWVALCAPGTLTSTGGVRVAIFDANANTSATSTSQMLPFNWIQIFKVTPGQKVAALSNDGIAGTLNVTELTN